MPAYNSAYPQVAVKWLIQPLCLTDSESLRYLHLRVAAKRCIPLL